MTARRSAAAAGVAVALWCAVTSAAAATLPGGQVMATDRFEYSYSSETQREIVENWLDASWMLGGLRAGILLSHRSPSEEGERANSVRHRFVEFTAEGLDLRAGHFYGLFGRGLVFAAHEDRTTRVDTALDGLWIQGARGRVRGVAFTGTPAGRDVDVRGADLTADVGEGVSAAVSGLTWRADDFAAPDGTIHREWVVAPRLEAVFPFGGCYAEYGWKKGWDASVVPDDRSELGQAFYAGVDLFRGPVGLSVEAKDYKRFTVVRAADGRTPLNNPPALTRQHLYTLLNRDPHAIDADNEQGLQGELTVSAPAGIGLLLNASRTERQDGRRIFEEVYAQAERERWGNLRLRGAFGYREAEGRRHTVIADVTWQLDGRHSLALEAEQQHVDLGGGEGFDLGAYNQQFLKIELGIAPSWAVAALLELNDKFDEQRQAGEQRGPFPALQVGYVTPTGADVTLWAGKRQAGYLCAGGICKYEPAFEGVELSGSLRY